MKLIFQYVSQYKRIMFVGLTIKIIGTIMDLLLPLIFAYMLDDIIPLGELSYIIWLGVLMIFCAFIGVSFNVIANRMAAKIAMLTTSRIRHDLFEKTLTLSVKQTDTLTISSLVSRMTSDTYNVHGVIGMSQRLGVRAPILLIGGIVMTLFLNVPLALIMLSCLPLIIIVIYFFTKKGVPLFAKVQTSLDKLITTVRENIVGIKVVKALNKEEYEYEKFQTVNTETASNDKAAHIKMARINPFLNIIMNLGLVCVIYVGAQQVYKGTIESGVIIAFLSYFTIILNAMLSIARLFINYSKAQASSKRIREVLEMPVDLVSEETNTKSNSFIEFRDVNFSYNHIKNNLSNISFRINKGKSLGIIGATGSGKTTLISLLLRLYDVDSGQVFVDGKNVKDYQLSELRSKFGVVFQNDIIFGETIRDNIDFGRNLSDEAISASTKNAQAYDFIERQGLDKLLVSKGSNLSGGEKQRVLLSRAMANNPEILILDDSSSALDYKTDKKLREAILKNFKDTTTVIVSSRIASVKNCDEIIVLDEGNIIAIGTHDELLSTCKLYLDIKTSQMGDSDN